ncbi:hypothetical protein C8J56DRAFT_1020398 [Mycena floridula]|nr:hypothetical protein C8J56DRAFT_1020398 [Mycena floridula]
MDFAASPEASTSDTYSRRQSPGLMTADLELDPLDPLNLILHNTSQTGTSSSDSSMDSSRNSPDWSQLSSMWSSGESTETKFNPDLMGFNLSSLGMDLDFNPSMVIEPSALHYDNNLKTHYPYDNSYSMPDMMSFPFTYQTFPPQEQQPRRLSITSSSSSSGASFSPILETAAPSVHQHQPNVEDYSNDPAAALAHRVRESAGVMLAVPMNGQGQNHASLLTAQLDIPHPSISGPISPVASTPPQSHSSSSSAASTPPPSTPPPANFAQPQNNAGIPRPKTSHTTIERRYRTNLNARIQSLRMAVPALRVLENHAELGTNSGGGGRKVKVKAPASRKIKKEGEEEEEEMDIVDERGFVDGVKVARKCSKANVLGKAVEYIRVLKKRENRLRREQAGLKSLVMGLVGGSALLREWEREWKENFGGEEKDEIQDEDLEEPDGGSDEEDGEEDDEDGEGRKRKKPKVTVRKEPVVREKKPIVPQAPTADGVIPEKRKRGRPRKQPLPPAPVQPLAEDVYMQHQQPMPQGPAHQQYLLATFALFSFFNSPLTSPSYSYSPHSTTGTVLSSHPAMQAAWGWREAIQAFHLLVSFLVFASIALPWLPVSKPGFSFPWPKSTNSSAQHPVSPAGETLHEALTLSKRGLEGEGRRLRAALKLDGPLSVVVSILKHGLWSTNISFEQKSLEQRAWVRLGELCVLGEEPVSSPWRLLTYLHMRVHLSWFTSSAADLSTLALVVYPFGPIGQSRAHLIWEEAKHRAASGDHVRAHEKLVLETMTVDEAIGHINAHVGQEKTKLSPINVVATELVGDRVKKSLEMLFIKNVMSDESRDAAGDDLDPRSTIDAARSLSGKLSEIGEVLESLWISSTSDFDAVSASLPANLLDSEGETDSGGDIKALLTALILYRRIFPSASINGSGNISILLSPPPSPGGKDSKLHYSLLRALGSSVFEMEEGDLGVALENARDRVVDLLNCDRRGRIAC